MKKEGLSPDHFEELNTFIPRDDNYFENAKKISKRMDELRYHYKDDPKALEQIDIFDPDSEYGKKKAELIILINKDLKVDLSDEENDRVDEINRWFEEDYPNVLKKTALILNEI